MRKNTGDWSENWRHPRLRLSYVETPLPDEELKPRKTAKNQLSIEEITPEDVHFRRSETEEEKEGGKEKKEGRSNITGLRSNFEAGAMNPLDLLPRNLRLASRRRHA